jgi:hypothetical protein
MTDRRPLGVADASGDEVGDGAVAAQHAKRPVAGAGEPGGQLDDALQGDRERKLAGKDESGLQQALVPLMGRSQAVPRRTRGAGGQAVPART